MTEAEMIPLIEHAAALLDSEALVLRSCHTLPGSRFLPGDEDAEAACEELRTTARRLYDLSDALRHRAGLTTPSQEAFAA